MDMYNLSADIVKPGCTLHRRMRVAINNMSQGLCMFDGNERLVVCNQRSTRRLRESKARVSAMAISAMTTAKKMETTGSGEEATGNTK